MLKVVSIAPVSVNVIARQGALVFKKSLCAQSRMCLFGLELGKIMG